MPDAPVDAEFTIGSGFPESGGWWVGGGISSISFWTVENVYTDACIRLGTLPDPPIGPTVDDLVAALGAQASTEMSAPVDVEVGGHQGVRVELTPGDGLPANCGPMYMWKSPTNPRTQPEGDPGRGIERDGVGEHVEPVWILDVDGERVVIVAYNAGHRPSAGDLTDPVMESMTLTKH